MAKSGDNLKRLEIPYFEGINAVVGAGLSKVSEIFHGENARSVDIGTIEKRAGTRRLGGELVATANYALFHFDNDGSTNTGFYRISTVGGVTSIYYLNTSAGWTVLTDADGVSLLEIGDSTTQFDITNPSGSTFRYSYDGTGTDPNIDSRMRVGSQLVINAQNFSAGNNGTFTLTGVAANYFEVTNASGVAESNKTIGTGSITLTGSDYASVLTEDVVFLVNGDHDNIYIENDGETVVSSADNTGHLYNSPKAKQIAYYKGKLYLGDYTNSGGTRYKNKVMMSSSPLGVLALVDGDHDAGVTSLSVTDTKYIYNSDTLDVYIGGAFVETLTVTGKTEDTITVNATANAIDSASELWVYGTNSGTDPKFRWSTTPAEGIAVKEYDTFSIGGDSDKEITMMVPIGEKLMIGNYDSLSTWDGYSLSYMDYGVGCVSRKGWIKSLGELFFIHYTGIFASTGGQPTLISHKVQPYIDGATKAGLEGAVMGRKGLSVFAAIGDVTLYREDGSTRKTLSDVCLEYNQQQKNWFVQTGIPAEYMATYLSSTDADRLMYAGTHSNYPVREFLRGQRDDDVSGDEEIIFRVDTGDITLADSFEKFVYPKEIIIEAERGSGLRCFVSLDRDSFYELPGNAGKGCTIVKVTSRDGDTAKPPRCRRINISLRDSTRKICRVSRVAIRYTETEEEENVDSETYGYV